MKYTVSYQRPWHQFVDIEMVIDNITEPLLVLQLPAWRPGRYELGNFARNIRKWKAMDGNGNLLTYRKVTKDRWEVDTNGASTVLVQYDYYASQMDAGACWLSESQLYINGVHCFLYVPDCINHQCELELKLPDNYDVATGLPSVGKNTFRGSDYHQLVDCPFIASANLKHDVYEIQGVKFHLWFQGNGMPAWDKMKKDFAAFSQVQYATMHSFPFSEYHFMTQLTDQKFYHGVEHANSTVLAFGPGINIMQEENYIDYLGLASHELFHAWNVKAVRPAEMMPYDYARENYSRLGFVAEGLTTYYGDLFLFRSHVYNVDTYLNELSKVLQKHYDNPGRLNLSVADSSFDTWLDGYVAGVPGRKSSIYTEGALCAFMLDIFIRRQTDNKHSLDEVIRSLYADKQVLESGYTEAMYIRAAEQVAGTDLSWFFIDHVFGAKSYDKLLLESFNYLGLKMVANAAPFMHEKVIGIKLQQNNGSHMVRALAPGSPADEGGLAINDVITGINNYEIRGNLNDIIAFHSKHKILVSFHRNGRERQVEMVLNDDNYFPQYALEFIDSPSPAQASAFAAWAGVRN